MTSHASSHPCILEVERTELQARTLELLPPRRARLREAIAAENRASARYGPLPTDPNVLLASEIASRMEGCVMPASAREDILDQAGRMGIRRFDASLLMALLQDRARRGEALHGLAIPFKVRQEQPVSIPHASLARWLSALLVGGSIAVLAIGWLLG